MPQAKKKKKKTLSTPEHVAFFCSVLYTRCVNLVEKIDFSSQQEYRTVSLLTVTVVTKFSFINSFFYKHNQRMLSDKTKVTTSKLDKTIQWKEKSPK